LRRAHDSHFNDDSCDGAVDSQWIFFADDQLVPVLLVNDQTLEASKNATDSLVKTIEHEISIAGKLAALSRDRFLLKLVVKTFRSYVSFRKGPSKIAYSWKRVVLGCIRRDQERHARQTRRMERALLRLKQPDKSLDDDVFEDEAIEFNLTRRQAPTGPTNASASQEKRRPRCERLCARRHVAFASRRGKEARNAVLRSIARRRAQDEKAGEVLSPKEVA
jgi:hypothetical protein